MCHKEFSKKEGGKEVAKSCLVVKKEKGKKTPYKVVNIINDPTLSQSLRSERGRF